MAGFTLQDRSCEGQSPGTISGGFTLGTLVTTRSVDTQLHVIHIERLGHFCLAPHVAMRVGLYLHPRPAQLEVGASRAVSEDPANICSFLLIVRTGRIVTVGTPLFKSEMQTSTAGYSDVPAYSGVLKQPGIN